MSYLREAQSVIDKVLLFSQNNRLPKRFLGTEEESLRKALRVLSVIGDLFDLAAQETDT